MAGFDGADLLTFFGQKFRGTEFQEKYTDERVYWLDIGGTAGPRIADVDATPQGDLTPPQDVAATVHAEQDYALDSALDHVSLVNVTQDTWFWVRAPAYGRLSRSPPPWDIRCPTRRRVPRQRSG